MIGGVRYIQVVGSWEFAKRKERYLRIAKHEMIAAKIPSLIHEAFLVLNS